MCLGPTVEKNSNVCSDCGIPLDSLYRNILITIHHDGTATSSTVCFVCHAMSGAANTPYFDKAEAEYEHRKRKIKSLRPGGDYLD